VQLYDPEEFGKFKIKKILFFETVMPVIVFRTTSVARAVLIAAPPSAVFIKRLPVALFWGPARDKFTRKNKLLSPQAAQSGVFGAASAKGRPALLLTIDEKFPLSLP
jgi:hypothetical protein